MICGVVSGFGIGALFGERGAGVAWVGDSIGGSGDRKEDDESKARDCQFSCTGVKDARGLGTRYGGLETCYWLCIELRTAGLRRAVMRLALAICCSTT